MDGRRLRERFVDFNVAYFANRLPPYAVRVVPKVKWPDGQGETIRERRLIKIRRGLPDKEAVGTLCTRSCMPPPGTATEDAGSGR
jgi:hypothetical protein